MHALINRSIYLATVDALELHTRFYRTRFVKVFVHFVDCPCISCDFINMSYSSTARLSMHIKMEIIWVQSTILSIFCLLISGRPSKLCTLLHIEEYVWYFRILWCLSRNYNGQLQCCTTLLGVLLRRLQHCKSILSQQKETQSSVFFFPLQPKTKYLLLEIWRKDLHCLRMKWMLSLILNMRSGILT